MNPARWLLVLGCTIAVGTALFHASGYTSVVAAMQEAGAKPFLVSAVRALWLMLSAHLIILSLAVAVAAWTPGSRRLVLLLALFPVADTLLLARFAGAFLGTFALAAIAVLLLAGGWLLPRQTGS